MPARRAHEDYAVAQHPYVRELGIHHPIERLAFPGWSAPTRMQVVERIVQLRGTIDRAHAAIGQIVGAVRQLNDWGD